VRKQKKTHENKQHDLIMNGQVFEGFQKFRYLGALIH